VQHGFVRVPLAQSGLTPDVTIQVADLLSGERYFWRGEWNYVRLDPESHIAHILNVTIAPSGDRVIGRWNRAIERTIVRTSHHPIANHPIPLHPITRSRDHPNEIVVDPVNRTSSSHRTRSADDSWPQAHA
jgi:hypothetical protein